MATPINKIRGLSTDIIKTEQYIREKKYKPTLSDILAYKPKTKVIDTIPKEQTKAYKLQHDPEYKTS